MSTTVYTPGDCDSNSEGTQQCLKRRTCGRPKCVYSCLKCRNKGGDVKSSVKVYCAGNERVCVSVCTHTLTTTDDHFFLFNLRLMPVLGKEDGGREGGREGGKEGKKEKGESVQQ